MSYQCSECNSTDNEYEEHTSAPDWEWDGETLLVTCNECDNYWFEEYEDDLPIPAPPRMKPHNVYIIHIKEGQLRLTFISDFLPITKTEGFIFQVFNNQPDANKQAQEFAKRTGLTLHYTTLEENR